jgi:hypothetical protein
VYEKDAKTLAGTSGYLVHGGPTIVVKEFANSEGSNLP